MPVLAKIDKGVLTRVCQSSINLRDSVYDNYQSRREVGRISIQKNRNLRQLCEGWLTMTSF